MCRRNPARRSQWSAVTILPVPLPAPARSTARSGGAHYGFPNRSTKSAECKREQKKRWFRHGQRWRTGCEGRISVSKRPHGLSCCRYRGDNGMKCWVGLGVIADNLINIGQAIAKRPAD
jgi:hypothetical protein